MKIELKQKALINLARTAGDVAETAIRKESAKIIAALQNETQYDLIIDQLDLLNTIAYRVHKETVEAIKDFLKRLNGLELTYQDIPGYPAGELRKYQNNYTLIVKLLEVLERIRYHQPSVILDIFFEYSCHEEENIVKQAKHGIEVFSSYDLDIFYGDGKDWPGLGWEPQEKALEKITTYDKTQMQKYFSAIIIACKQILSPTISGTSSNYKTVTFRTNAVPAKDGLKNIRKKALEILQNLYAVANNFEQKSAILNAIDTATSTPHMGNYGDDVLAMILENTVAVIEFMKDIVVSEELQAKQKIEHDAYWLLCHKGELDEIVYKVALEIRDLLYADEEYQKFRILIGFESIFQDWEKGGKESQDFDYERKFREAETQKLAETIDTDSFNEWKERIIRYASIESNDLATFPYFVKFLEHFGRTSPALALKLLLETSDQLENFIIAILCGVAETDLKGDVYSLIDGWCDEGKYLFSLARFFEFSPEVNEVLIKKILDKAEVSDDENTLNQIIFSVSAQYNEENKHLISKFFMPALEKLTAHKNSSWISGFWFRKQRGDILSNMEVAGYKAILDNLIWLQKIDYHAEEVLVIIANRSPEMVIQFFCNRLSMEKDEAGYDSIPFSFHKLSEPLSQHPVQAIDTVLNLYDGDSGMFTDHGARLLKNIFPNFPIEFEQKLLEIVQSKEENGLLFVMAILSNYEGNPIIQNVCKEIVKILPDLSDLTGRVEIILESTGVLSGEYGRVNAYKQKIEEILPWLQDTNNKVKEFARNYVANLEKQIEHEQKRTEEDIILLKHKYGESEG